ncbi:putative E3 ubiquitin-protein ligase SINA-like 9 [Prunus avium]|uniref:RING-type E3 ubiquitin transferase n=1 Tax=Prunus avium TaxID=42229 RepID=A0A6P5T522_PRUAV|nr:putative E3 ubiquitin-protein ligase SINA-like 9 [Prunus avium]
MARLSSSSGDSDDEVPLRARHQRSGARRPFSWLREDSDEQVSLRPRHKRARVRRFYEEETEEEEEESDEYGGEEAGEGSGEYGGEEVGEEERDEYGGVGEEERYEYGGEEVGEEERYEYGGEEERYEYGGEVGREREEERDFLNHIEGAGEEEDPNNEAQVHEQQQDGSQSHVSITLTDPELFDCPICCEPLTIPVYQCDQNGHIACSSCFAKINNKCPSCSGFIGFSRCRAIEKALESIKTSCQNIKYGCNQSFTLHKKVEHINACVYSPCSCPHCNFVSPDIELYQHFRISHATFATQFKYNCFFSVSLNAEASFLVLQEKNDDTLFVLKKNYVEDVGNSVKVTCIQPGFRKGFLYQLQAKAKKTSLKLEAFTESTPSRQAIDNPKTGFLLIPCDFISPGGQLKMEICIECFEMY